MKSKLTEKGGFEKLISDSYVYNNSRNITLTSEERLITKFIQDFIDKNPNVREVMD